WRTPAGEFELERAIVPGVLSGPRCTEPLILGRGRARLVATSLREALVEQRTSVSPSGRGKWASRRMVAWSLSMLAADSRTTSCSRGSAQEGWARSIGHATTT